MIRKEVYVLNQYDDQLFVVRKRVIFKRFFFNILFSVKISCIDYTYLEFDSGQRLVTSKTFLKRDYFLFFWRKRQRITTDSVIKNAESESVQETYSQEQEDEKPKYPKIPIVEGFRKEKKKRGRPKKNDSKLGQTVDK